MKTIPEGGKGRGWGGVWKDLDGLKDPFGLKEEWQ